MPKFFASPHHCLGPCHYGIFNCNVNHFAICLYEFETWSLTLREERRPRVFENRVLRGIFVAKRDGVTGEWRKLLEELNDLYCSPNIFGL